MTGGDTVSDAIVAGTGSGEVGDAIQSSKRKKADHYSVFESPTPAGTCSNCGTVLSGPVCHSCGQTSDTFHRPIWDLLLDVLDGLFGIEGRLWRTLPALMFRPGKLTRQYLSGVRARYVMPFRLYLTASVLFFLAFSLVNGGGTAPDAGDIEANRQGLEEARAGLENAPPEVRDQVTAGLDAAQAELDAMEAVPPEVRAMQRQQNLEDIKLNLRQALLPEFYPDSETASDGEDEVVEMEGWNISLDDDITELPLWFRQRLADQADRIVDTEGEALWVAMKTWAPRLLFLMLPIYALLLAATHFYKRGFFFYDHLIVSLHFHAFLFFQFILLGLMSLTIGAGWAMLVFVLWSNYYLYRLHRTVYAHGRFSSAVRTLFMDFVYSIILSFGLLLLLFVGIFMAV
ncbi:DUF3667 domain-containing protein [Maricaulis sp.]|uniref:DUF3667 domain-containing protein n=1 Tax=Maricaulis sp. TaxID=1486257 RepID=UPI002636E329|nr:DUF3667 domain-containing protein [Maricaulis sp.]